jgi:hypothetical protein
MLSLCALIVNLLGEDIRGRNYERQTGRRNRGTRQEQAKFFSGVGCWGSIVVIGVSLLLFMIACATPAMVFDKETWPGIQVLVLGWQGVFLGQFAWFANAFWSLSLLLVFFRRWFLTLVATFITFLISLDALSFVGTKVPLDEAFVNTMFFQSYHVGYYVWMASIGVVGVGAAAMWFITWRISR